VTVRRQNGLFDVARAGLLASTMLVPAAARAADAGAPRPLLVVLHGDGESAASIEDVWKAAATARGIVLFAPACPRSEGCTSRSWWKWDGSPAWLLRQIDALAQTHPIDRDRMWIAGWSGGGTYVAWNTQEMERTFAALVIVGGGVRPKDSRCSDPRASVYFLGGDANPLHYLTDELHDFYVRCGHDVKWTVLGGVDHPGERRALVKQREAILDWLDGKRPAQRAPDALDAGSGADGAPDAPVSAPPPPLSTTQVAPPPQPPPVRSSCTCDVAGSAPGRGETALALCGALVGALGLAARRVSPRRFA
jgi:predicted esterase